MNAAPVWVRGQAVERRKRSLAVECLTAETLPRAVRLILPRSQLRGERECRADPAQREFLVPEWWARAGRVGYSVAESSR